MNTLLGELATLNDIQYARYRLSIKLRQLQKSLQLDKVDISVLQEGLHLSGVESLSHLDIVPTSQLISSVHELYECLRLQRPVLISPQLKQAQDLCENWLQMNYQCSTGGKIQAGSLKVTLCLLTGAKIADKARYMFSVLANSNGAVGFTDTTYFWTITQQLAGTLQEDLFSNCEGPEQLWRQCLVSVRSADDVIDDEIDGGEIKRQWLSQFEFVKLFSSHPEPSFLKWWTLYHRLPGLEKVMHLVRCSVCSRKPLVAFRYQCTECSNFNLCQMCFLKGRTAGKHEDSHQVVEMSSPSKAHKSWRYRLLGAHDQDGRMWDEPKIPFVFNPRTSSSSSGSLGDGTAAPANAINDMLACSQQQRWTPNGHQVELTHKPTMIRVGSQGDLISQPAAQKKITTPTHEKLKSGSLSTNSCSSIDSAYSLPDKSNYEGVDSVELHNTNSGNCNDTLRSSRSCDFLQKRSTDDQPVYSLQRRMRQQEDLAEINRRLSVEVDMLLSDISPTPVKKFPLSSSLSNTISTTQPQRTHSLELEGMASTNQVSSPSSKRNKQSGNKPSGGMEGLISQVQSLHVRSVSLSQGFGLTSSHDEGRQDSPLVGNSYSSHDSLPVNGHAAQSVSNHWNHSPLMTSSSVAYQGLGGSQKLTSDLLPDPMKDYEPTTETEWYPETNRFSVDW